MSELQFLLYKVPETEGKVEVAIKNDTIWCAQKAMAELFGIDKSGISRHLSNIYKKGELSEETTVAKIATVVNRGIRGRVEELIDFYSLDAIISVGYQPNKPGIRQNKNTISLIPRNKSIQISISKSGNCWKEIRSVKS